MADSMIPLFAVNMPTDVDEPLLKTLHSGYITEGPKVKEFEDAFGSLINNRLVLAVNSGTMALTIALRLAYVQAGDEVVTTPMTCTATNLPILSLGALPVWADVNHRTGLIDPDSVRERITRRTKAIMCVDWGGMPCNIQALRAIGSEFGIPVIEDAAHALLASYKGYRVGSPLLSDFTCFSLQAIKHMTTVDGGVLAVVNVRDYQRGKKLRWFGIDRDAKAGDSRIDVDIEEWGYKGHMNDVAATIGLAQFGSLLPKLRAQVDNAHFYHHALSSFYDKPVESDRVRSTYWLYTILFPSTDLRKGFREFMAERGIQVSRVHRRNDEYTVFKGYGDRELPGLDSFAGRMMCIPVHWALSFEDRNRVVNACNDWAAEQR